MLVLLNDSSDTPYSSVISIPHIDSCVFASCMNDLVISNVDRYMSYTVHYLIADQSPGCFSFHDTAVPSYSYSSAVLSPDSIGT